MFQQGSFCFGTGFAQRQWLCAKGFSEFFGKTIEQHAMEGLEFEGCKSCMVQSSSTGDLHQLSIHVLSTLCYRLRPTHTIYPTVIAQPTPGSCELRALLFWSHDACFTRARFLRACSKLDILCYGRQIEASTLLNRSDECLAVNAISGLKGSRVSQGQISNDGNVRET